jgi:hypothetical protein
LGTWPASDTIPEDLVSFRQNLEPLVEDARLNPSGRVQWGFQLPGTSMLTHRSGLCVTSTGHMIYAWGPEVGAETLGNAMIMAGCAYGVHLDMNPHHTAFAFLDIRDVNKREFDAKILTPEMEVMPERFIVWSPKDFFYLTLRNLEPPPIEGLELEADEGVQPPPAWAPAVWRGHWAAEAGAKVRLLALTEDRVELRLRAGTESSGGRALPNVLDPQDAHQVLAALSLGMPGKGRALGLRVGGLEGASFGADGALVTSPGAAARIVASSDRAPAGADLIELPLLLWQGSVRDVAHHKGPMRRRGALGMTKSGTIWIATTTAASDEPLAAALLKAGCESALLIDRGGHDAPVLARAGTSSPPLDRYEHPTLYVLGKPMRSGAYRWNSPTSAGAVGAAE